MNNSEDVLVEFKKIFLEYNQHTNLISKNDEKFLDEKHIFDSLAIGKFLDCHEFKNLLDIGTGGGFPAIPISISKPDIFVLGVDSIQKKINFINFVAEKLGLKNLQGLCSRTEELPKQYVEYFDVVTSRAVAPLNIILEYAAPYLKTGGYFVAYKSQTFETEIAQAKNAMKVLNFELKEIIDYKLPLDENFERKLIVLEKIDKTPAKFPRKAGMAKSNPL